MIPCNSKYICVNQNIIFLDKNVLLVLKAVFHVWMNCVYFHCSNISTKLFDRFLWKFCAYSHLKILFFMKSDECNNNLSYLHYYWFFYVCFEFSLFSKGDIAYAKFHTGYELKIKLLFRNMSIDNIHLF